MNSGFQNAYVNKNSVFMLVFHKLKQLVSHFKTCFQTTFTALKITFTRFQLPNLQNLTKLDLNLIVFVPIFEESAECLCLVFFFNSVNFNFLTKRFRRIFFALFCGLITRVSGKIKRTKQNLDQPLNPINTIRDEKHTVCI